MIIKQKNVATSKKLYFEKKGPEVKKQLYLHFMTTLHNFTLLFFTQYLLGASKISDFWTSTVSY